MRFTNSFVHFQDGDCERAVALEMTSAHKPRTLRHLLSPDRGPSCSFVLCLLWRLSMSPVPPRLLVKRSTRRYPTTGAQPGLCLLSDKHSWNNKTLSEGKGSTRRAGLSNFLFGLVASFIRSVSPLAFSPFSEQSPGNFWCSLQRDFYTEGSKMPQGKETFLEGSFLQPRVGRLGGFPESVGPLSWNGGTEFSLWELFFYCHDHKYFTVFLWCFSWSLNVFRVSYIVLICFLLFYQSSWGWACSGLTVPEVRKVRVKHSYLLVRASCCFTLR